MFGRLLLIVVLVAGCGQQPAASVSPSGASPAQVGSPTPAAAARIPVELFPTGPTYSPTSGGFFEVAAGTYEADAQSQVTNVSDQLAGTSESSAVQRTSAQPYLYGTRASGYGFATISYDAAVGRWLPVGRQQISPDGRSYAYTEEWYGPLPSFPPGAGGCCPQPVGGRIHIVAAASGREINHVDFAAWPDYQVVLFSDRVIYLDATCNGDQPGCNELWALDLTTLELRVVAAQQGEEWTVEAGSAWTVTIGNGDIAPIHLLRIDLSTGVVETWLTVPAYSASHPYAPSMVILGVDRAGEPWVALNSQSPTPLLRVSAPDQTEQIMSADGPYSELLSDPTGEWFAVVNNASPTPTMLGLYRYRPQSGAIMVSPLGVLPA